MTKLRTTFIWITLFSIAMGYMESAVVVYLRELFYPEGFTFPLQPIDGLVAVTEILREAATIIMLIGIGVVAGKTNIERFAWFIYCFAVWDIFYYIFLKVLIGWPESFLTWDILFLIPVTWVGPVIAPILVSLTMILLALVIVKPERVYGVKTKVYKLDWMLFILGSLIIIGSFTEEYTRFILNSYSLKVIWSLPNHKPLFDLAYTYEPEIYRWWIFWIGELIILFGIGRIYFRNWRR